MEAAGWHEVGDRDAEVDGGRKKARLVQLHEQLHEQLHNFNNQTTNSLPNSLVSFSENSLSQS
jgi:hypothetical protein